MAKKTAKSSKVKVRDLKPAKSGAVKGGAAKKTAAKLT
jgi:hypothetical protein